MGRVPNLFSIGVNYAPFEDRVSYPSEYMAELVPSNNHWSSCANVVQHDERDVTRGFAERGIETSYAGTVLSPSLTGSRRPRAFFVRVQQVRTGDSFCVTSLTSE